MVTAYVFLRLRCRGIGYPFGPLARWWSYSIITLTAIISAFLGLAAGAASGQVHVAYVGVVLPIGLLLGRAPGDMGTRAGRAPGWLSHVLSFPLRRLNDRMGDDMHNWCQERHRAVADNPKWVADAAQYYCNQVAGRIKDGRTELYLGRLRESIQHKIKVMRAIELGDSPARLRNALQAHPATANQHQFTVDDLDLLSGRLRTEAEHELGMLLAFIHKRGFHKLLIYPFRPPKPGRPARRRGPSTPAAAGPG
ncbi:MAG TPA: hypothetical protein VKS82_08590 [Streptosporangiaceae bacterium]|nr:hypothetical protein [Streptosporangiaceae bacterium]